MNIGRTAWGINKAEVASMVDDQIGFADALR